MIAVIKVGKIHTVSFTICDSLGHCFPSKAFLATSSRRFPRSKAFVPFFDTAFSIFVAHWSRFASKTFL